MNLSDRPSFVAAAPTLKPRGQGADSTEARWQLRQVAFRLLTEKGIAKTSTLACLTPNT